MDIIYPNLYNILIFLIINISVFSSKKKKKKKKKINNFLLLTFLFIIKIKLLFFSFIY